MKEYNHQKIEKKWQTFWEKNKINQAKDSSKKPKYYSLIEFPYPSGDGLHVGHPRPYIGMDVISRKRRLEGYNVLYPIGWDAFGLPTENYAIKTGKDPRVVTKKNSDTFRRQIKSLGISFDWSREINTTDPKYYKWTQWIFLQFLKKGLAYKAKIAINWCLKDKIGLANEEVVGGNCERCGSPVEKREKEQWMLGITKYADRLDKDLDTVDYLPQIKLSQRNWIGRSEGAEIDFPVAGADTVKRIVILHGKHGSPDNYVYPWLKEQFEKKGYLVELPTLPNTEEPNDEEQADYVEKHCTLDENTAIISHSFGGIVAMRLLERGKKIQRVVLACVPFSGKFNDNKIRKTVSDACIKGFDFNTIKKNSREFIVLRDERDEIVPSEDAELWQKNLNGILLDGQGLTPHFSGEKEPDMLYASIPTVRVFTTRPDTIFGATYLVLAPEHELVQKLKAQITNWSEIEKYIQEVKKKTEIERTSDEKITSTGSVQVKTGVELKGVKAVNPANQEEIPIWIADYVLPHYGTGAIMAVPAHDERDFAFAKKYDLEMKEVIAPYWLDEIQKPKEDKETEKREVVGMIIRRPRDDKYLCLKWPKRGWQAFPTGGIEGEDKEKAARREILEETGYKNLKFIKEVPGSVYAEFWRPHKGSNVLAHFHFLAFELENEEVDEIDQSEKDEHSLIWISKSEVMNFLNVPNQKFAWRRFNEDNLTFSGNGILTNSGQFNGLDSQKAKKEIIKFVGGKEKTTFKLRDWVFSRQRYWGEPIPVVLCSKCGIVPVPEKNLPVLLPKVKNYQPTDSGESPLANIAKWVNTKCPKCKGKARRETDTMPNWAGSSWYYLRYVDHQNKKEFAGKKNLKYWTSVDWYNGGNEHTTLHLLYSRFWHKFLFDLGLVPTSEPYKKRTSHGMILGEGGVKMSKSLGNVINPDEMVKTYGADTLRVYEMFMGPFNQSVAWSTESIIGARRFIEKVWRIGQKIASPDIFVQSLGTSLHSATPSQKHTGSALHKTIKKVSEDIENMQFNTAIAALMILANEMDKMENIEKDDFKKFLQILSPFAPHIVEELWNTLGEKKSVNLSAWPKWDENLIQDEEVKIAVQVNGKVRAELTVQMNSSEEEIKKQALAGVAVQRHLAGGSVKKIIYVKNKLINIVV